MADKVYIPKPQHGSIIVEVEGDSPLLTHKFSKKSKDSILSKQTKKAKGGREARDVEAEFQSGLYRMDGQDQEDLGEDPRDVDPESETFAIPAIAFKKAMVRAAKHVDGLDMTDARNAFQVIGDMVPLVYDKLVRHEARVTIGRGNSDLRFRPCFHGWRASFKICYDAEMVSADQVVNLLNRAGFGVGVGDWRPAKDGSFGMFHVAGMD